MGSMREKGASVENTKQITETKMEGEDKDFPLIATETELDLQQLQSCCVDPTKNKTLLMIDPGADSFADDAAI